MKCSNLKLQMCEVLIALKRQDKWLYEPCLVGVVLSYVSLSNAVGHLDVVKFLVKRGADVAQKNLALSSAVNKGHLDVVKFLVENGADVQARENSALRWAARYGHLEVVKFLVENGADVQAREN